MPKNKPYKFLISTILLIGVSSLIVTYKKHRQSSMLIPLHFSVCNENNTKAIWNIEINNSRIGSVESSDTNGGDGKPVTAGSFCKTLEYSTNLTEGTAKITRISNGVSNTFIETVNFTQDPYIYVFASTGIHTYPEKPQLTD